MCKWLNSTRIDPQNNQERIKEILRHYNRLNASINKRTRKAKDKYSICKESNKSVKNLDIILKEIDKAIEETKKY